MQIPNNAMFRVSLGQNLFLPRLFYINLKTRDATGVRDQVELVVARFHALLVSIKVFFSKHEDYDDNDNDKYNNNKDKKDTNFIIITAEFPVPPFLASQDALEVMGVTE